MGLCMGCPYVGAAVGRSGCRFAGMEGVTQSATAIADALRRVRPVGSQFVALHHSCPRVRYRGVARKRRFARRPSVSQAGRRRACRRVSPIGSLYRRVVGRPGRRVVAQYQPDFPAVVTLRRLLRNATGGLTRRSIPDLDNRGSCLEETSNNSRVLKNWSRPHELPAQGCERDGSRDSEGRRMHPTLDAARPALYPR